MNKKIRLVKIHQKQGITEELKANDMMAWVGAMNNIKNQRLWIFSYVT